MGFTSSFSLKKQSEDSSRLATEQTVASLLRPITPLSVDSPIAKVVEVLRQSTLHSYPVVSGSKFVTTISSVDLSSGYLDLEDTDVDYSAQAPLGSVLHKVLEDHPAPPLLHLNNTIGDARRFFIEYPDVSVAAIVDSSRTYAGVLTRTDLLAYNLRTLAPARVGGMATPLGVYLTDGILSGGVGNFGLVLAGITLSCLFVISTVAMNSLDMALLDHHIDVNAILESRLFPILPDYAVTLVLDLRSGLPLLLMLLLLRTIPVAGYHAAEHQVVHCIERGEPLLPRIVARMPRPHPRCGTNLVSAVMLFTVFLSVLTVLFASPSAAIVPAILATVATWRQVGTFLQQYITTRPASEKQIASGIRAGQDLMSKFRQNTNRRGSVPLRIWRMGLIQMLIGSSIPVTLLWLLNNFFPVVQPYLQGIY